MSRLLVLPTPLPSNSIALGQLIADPVHADSVTFSPLSRPECQQPRIQSMYQSTITHDEHGRFVSFSSERPRSSNSNDITVNAEQSLHTSLASPRAAFNALRCDAATQTFLRKSASNQQPLYYVTSIQTLKNPSFQRASTGHGRIAEAPAAKIRLPMNVRRVDSAFGLDNTNDEKDTDEEAIFAVELMKVRCHVNSASTPHGVEDIGYEWSYHLLDEGDLQLSIGLGKALEASELSTLAGITVEEECSDKSWDSQDEDEDEEDGIGGF